MLDIEFRDEFLPEAELCLGVDEVGRGPLAGPVVSCAISIEGDIEPILKKLNDFGVCDSKKMTNSKRLSLLESLNINVEKLKLNKVYQSEGFQFALAEADHHKIDEINIHHASLYAMKLALEKLLQKSTSKKALVLVDGKWIPKEVKAKTELTLEAIIKGDSKSLMIGMASIIAKEFRDSLMKKFDQKYPGYGLGGHSGYPTPKHKAAIEELGPCPIHRATFKGVKEFI